MPEPLLVRIHDRIATILTRHVSPILADGLLTRALRECRLTSNTVTGENLIVLYAQLEPGVRLFVEPGLVDQIWTELDELAAEFHPHCLVTIPVVEEADVAEAAHQARLFCQRMRARPVATERIATIVSELARNIVSYTPGGHIELGGERGEEPRIRLCAADRGSGIPNLAEVLSGRFRRISGAGKGITGVKRLADTFAIHTSETGTRVEVEVSLADDGG